jgi:hypothetical protein
MAKVILSEGGSEQDAAPLAKTMTYHYLKSPFFRAVHADGVYGGITPHGSIHMGFFSERNPFPTQTEYEITDNKLGREIEESRIVKPGFVREVDVDVIMDLTTAIALQGWLTDKIAKLKAHADKAETETT